MKTYCRLFLLLFVIGVSSCREPVSTDVYHINLEKSITSLDSKLSSLDPIIESYKLIPLETNDSILLSSLYIKAVTDKFLFIESNNTIYSFKKNDGQFFSIIGTKGNGPNEYIAVSDFEIGEKNRELYLYDENNKKILTYNFEGTFISSKHNDLIGGFCLLNDSTFAVSYKPFSENSYAVGIYNSEWKLQNQYISVEKQDMQGNLFYYNDFNKFNGQYYYMQTLNDTLYRIEKNRIAPFLIVSKGNLKAPFEVIIDIKKKKKDGYKYILGEFGYLALDYYFLTYYYNGTKYQDVWNITNASLLYRNIDLNNDGIPITIGAKKIFVWPIYVNNNYVYCLINSELAVQLLPDLPVDTNPIVIEIKLKDI